MMQPVDVEIPLAVLVNERSASASEIVAGAIQDLDRGIIVGNRSYGKGLVQKVIPLSFNAQMKVTIAKYYIPSGRCIQAIDYFHQNSKLERLPDSLRKAYLTKNKRRVYDGAGIDPDVLIENPMEINITKYLQEEYVIFDFCNQYKKGHTSISDTLVFDVDKMIFDEFKLFAKSKELNYQSKTEKELKELKAIAVKEKYSQQIKPHIEKIEKEIMLMKSKEIDANQKQISSLIRKGIVMRYYYERGRIINSLDKDEAMNKAIKMLRDKSSMQSILNVK